MDDFTELVAIALPMLQRNEGYRQFIYQDSRGILTIGHGRNLESRGIDRLEAAYLLRRDINEAGNRCISFPFWDRLTLARQAVLIDLSVNLGWDGLLEFKKMLAWLDSEHYLEAAQELRHSAADKQEPARIERNALILESGEVPA